MIHQKHRKSLEEITNDLCPVLSVQQLYRISTMYWDDRCGVTCIMPCVGVACHKGTNAVTVLQLYQPWTANRAACSCFIGSSRRRYNTETVSHEVLARMKQLMVDNNTAASHSFLLDDDSSIPFSLDDIAALMEDKARPCHGTSR